MVKRGPLNKVEKYFIEGNTDLPVEDLAAELDRSEAMIKKHLSTVTTVEEPQPAQSPPPKREKQSQFFKQMGRHRRNGKGKPVATVMTKAASELADAQRKKRKLNKKLESAIHKPYVDEE